MASLRDIHATFSVKYESRGLKQATKDLNAIKKTVMFVARALRSTEGSLKRMSTGFNKAGKDAAKLNVKLNKLGASMAKVKAKGSGAGKAAAASGGGAAGGGIGAALGGAKGLVAGFGLFQAAAGVKALLSAASEVEETENILGEVFGAKGRAEVQAYAKTVGKEIGRSEFQLRDYAGAMGALVSPQLRNMGAEGAVAAQTISQDFAKLSVDMASFFNRSEDDAFAALRSGLSGETEPLKRFGINLTEEGIANALGITKKQVAAMTVAEKTMSRYRAIMLLTKQAQGDAARTADGYANRVRKLESTWRDTKVILGNVILPILSPMVAVMEKLVASVGAFSKEVGRLARTTMIFETIGLALAALAVGFAILKASAIASAIAAAAAWLVAAAPFILFGVFVAAVIALIEDLWTGVQGGESILGTLVDDITGVTGALEGWADHLAQLLTSWDFFKNSMIEGWSIIGDKIWALLDGPIKAVKSVWDKFFGGSGSTKIEASQKAFRASLSGPPGAGVAGNTAPLARGANGGSTVDTSMVFNITAPGGNARDIGREAGRATRTAMAEQRRQVQQGT